jgi:hypothetical protein
MDEQTSPSTVDDGAALGSDLASVQEARAQFARGEYVTMEAVTAWIDSWKKGQELPLPQPVLPLTPSAFDERVAQ